MRSLLRSFFTAAVVALFCPALARAELRLGVYAQDISPQKLPVNVSGDFFNRTADTIHMPLHARCFVLDDGKTKIAMGIIDSCGLGRPTLDAAKALASKSTGIPADRIMLSATHTHRPSAASGPSPTRTTSRTSSSR
jgi:hypothetical protein